MQDNFRPFRSVREWAAIDADRSGIAATMIVAARVLLVVLGYLIMEWLSYLHSYKGIPVTPWNPGLGIVFGLAIVGGPFYAIPLGVGVFLTDAFVLKTGMNAGLNAAIAIVTTLGYAGAAQILRRRVPVNLALPRVRDVVLLLMTALAAAFLLDLLISGLLIIDERIERHDFLATLLPLFVGDALGIAVFTPIVLQLTERLRRANSILAALPNGVMVATAALIVLTIIALHFAFGISGQRYVFVLFIPVVFAAIRDGSDGACFSLAAAQIGLVGVMQVTGQDLPTFIEVQAQMLVLTIIGLVVGAIVTERQSIAAAGQVVAARLKALEVEAAQAARVSLAEGMASALAHEINQPITAVRALARSVEHILAAPAVDMERARRNLGDMIAQVDHAGQIVRRMREFLRRGRPHISTIEVDTLLRNVVSLIGAEAKAHHVQIAIGASGDIDVIFGDRTQIEQVLLNLIRNSLEAIGDHPLRAGLIEIGTMAHAKEGHVTFFVRDNGPGIPPDRVTELFNPLISHKPNGLGLGLAISASIIMTHHGKLWLETNRPETNQPGQTEFRFSLPLDAGLD